MKVDNKEKVMLLTVADIMYYFWGAVHTSI